MEMLPIHAVCTVCGFSKSTLRKKITGTVSVTKRRNRPVLTTLWPASMPGTTTEAASSPTATDCTWTTSLPLTIQRLNSLQRTGHSIYINLKRPVNCQPEFLFNRQKMIRESIDSGRLRNSRQRENFSNVKTNLTFEISILKYHFWNLISRFRHMPVA